MGNFDKILKGRVHKERSQPSFRKKFGFLEKKQDYKKRAKFYSEQKQKIKELKRKVALKNEDEYNPLMKNSKLSKDKTQIEITKKTPNLNLDKFITREKNYINLKQNQIRKKIEKNSSISDHNKNRKHKIFVDNSLKLKKFSLENYFQTPTALLSNPAARLKNEQLEKLKLDISSDLIQSIDDQKKLKHSILLENKKKKYELNQLSEILNQKKQSLEEDEEDKETDLNGNEIVDFLDDFLVNENKNNKNNKLKPKKIKPNKIYIRKK
eukprot:TRINITY_DN1849_c2_g2_i1.p1 TRINITY_DN1849_c2_g2~~TRINITY_DN1849_c2_g2_i1.p1  ORF type:complete len:267 (-),score=96.55 TRINITY_DN1849_c2_g2_i1:178-978(-)